MNRTKMPNHFRRLSQGFTLIELMITVAIVAILAAVAYPSYAQYIRRGQRAAARTTMLEAAQYMQRFYAANERYDTQRDGVTAVALPDNLKVSPSSGSKSYDISLQAVDPTSYTLQAVPAGALTGDKCGTYTLTSTGTRGVAGGATATVADCWR